MPPMPPAPPSAPAAPAQPAEPAAEPATDVAPATVGFKEAAKSTQSTKLDKSAVGKRLSKGFLKKGMKYLKGGSNDKANKENDEADDGGLDEDYASKDDAFFYQVRFALKNYVQLRPSEDFASASIFGTIKNFRKTKDEFLDFSNSTIPKSLMEMEPEPSKQAVQLHKNLLGFMGDKRMPFPSMLAQKILDTGFNQVDFRDEIYAQVMKQLTKNTGTDSVGKGWQMLAMSATAFSPSKDFLPYVKHFMLTHRDGIVDCPAVVKDYASYCLTCLKTTLDNDGVGFVPSAEEIQAYKKFFPTMK